MPTNINAAGELYESEMFAWGCSTLLLQPQPFKGPIWPVFLEGLLSVEARMTSRQSGIPSVKRSFLVALRGPGGTKVSFSHSNPGEGTVAMAAAESRLTDPGGTSLGMKLTLWPVDGKIERPLTVRHWIN